MNKRKLTGMDRIDRIRERDKTIHAAMSSVLHPGYPVHPCLNLLLA
jgi:hypothetical protein